MNVDNKTGLVHEWTIVCQSTSIDKERGSLSIFNITDKINVSKEHFEKNMAKEEGRLFVVPADFEIISVWSKSNSEQLSLEIKTEMLDSYGESLFHFSYNIFLREGRQKARNRSKIKGLKVTGAGIYVINLSVRKDEGEEYRSIARTEIDVILSNFEKQGK